MPLLQPPVDAKPEQVAQWAQAELLVAAALGCSALEQRTVTQSGMLSSEVISLKEGPLTKLDSFTVNDYPAYPEAHPWHIRMPKATAGYGLVSYAPYYAGVYVAIYTAGWASEAELPGPVKLAVELMAAGLISEADTEGLTEYRLGDVTEKYAATRIADGLPTQVLALLRPYQKLVF